jgi:signal transduction histidine kinase
VFFESVEGKRRVREVTAHNCSLAEIGERRRDYTRDPYRTALESKGPIRVDGSPRPFFTRSESDEHSYLVPLLFAGKVLGFWALSVPAARAAGIDNFEAMVRDYADQIADLLYHRLQSGAERAQTPRWRRLLTQTREDEEHRALSSTIGLLEQRLRCSEQLFAASAIPTIAYDLFGRVRDVNPAMLEYLRGEGLAPYEMDVVNLIAALTAKDLTFARRCFRHLLHDQSRLALPVQPRHDQGHHLARLYALRTKGEGQPSEPAPFNIQGICCELLDRTALVQLARIKEQLAGQVGVHLRNDLASIELSASLLAVPDLSAAEREEFGTMISEKVRRAVATLAAAQQYFGVDVPSEVDRLPVDAHAAFQAAAQAVEPLAQTQSARLQVIRPDLMHYVLAAPDQLRQCFEFILTLFIKDARAGSTVNIRVEETPQGVSYTFTNTGFGFAQERFQECLFGSEVVATEDFRDVRTALSWVQAWGGTVEATSQVGEGMTLTVALPRFA